MPSVDINNHNMYYEIHGKGEPAICMGGWGTYCHGGEGGLARGLTDRYSVLVIDYRGIVDSSDPPAVEPTMKMHAADVIGLLDHLGWKNVHFIGLVGMGACIAHEVAIQRPDLVRTMVNMGCWAKVDTYLRDQLECFIEAHKEAGFYAFQKLVTVLSFSPDFYNANKERLLGPEGGWKELNGNYVTHERLVKACISHDVADRLGEIKAPSLIIHAGKDVVTSPRYTIPIEEGIPNATGVMMEDVAHVVAGKEQKIRFCDTLYSFLEKH